MFRIMKEFRRINVKCRNICNVPVAVLGAPLSKGQPKSGVDLGPVALRKFGLLKELKELGIDVRDYGDIKFIDHEERDQFGKVKNPLSVGSACHQIADRVKSIIQNNMKCLTLGGDHSIAIGTIYGHAQACNNICVLWIDAHADINTCYTTSTGNMHGMPCSFLLQELQKFKVDHPAFHWLKPCLKKKNFAYIGLRDVDPLEVEILNKEKILYFSMEEVDRLGIIEVTNRALKTINPKGDLSLHVSFDIDSIDKSITPSTGTPVLGGLTVREALCMAEEIFRTGSLTALELVEINPTLGTEIQVQDTLSVAVLVIKAFLGHSRSGNIPKDINLSSKLYS